MNNLINLKKNIYIFGIICIFSSLNRLTAQITCPYPVNNITGCSVGITYELLDNTCTCPAGCGPISVSLTSGINLIGSAGQCIASGWDIIIHVDFVGTTTYGAPITCVDGGCAWPSTVYGDADNCTAGGGWTITWTSGGATITTP